MNVPTSPNTFAINRLRNTGRRKGRHTVKALPMWLRGCADIITFSRGRSRRANI
jgi:hypothetical protein